MNSQNEDQADSSISDKDMQAVGEQAVAEYLRRNPEFFQDKPTLLTDLRIPHEVGGAVSLVERQMAALRESSERQQKQLQGLIQIARENDRLSQRLHQLTLGIMSCDSLSCLLELVMQRLREDFAADLLAVHLLAAAVDEQDRARAEFVAEPGIFRELFGKVLDAGKPCCERLKPAQLQALFGGQADAVGSTALLPLGEHGAIGLLAICSYDSGRFHVGMDTAFLMRMAQVISAALARHLSTPV